MEIISIAYNNGSYISTVVFDSTKFSLLRAKFTFLPYHADLSKNKAFGKDLEDIILDISKDYPKAKHMVIVGDKKGFVKTDYLVEEVVNGISPSVYALDYHDYRIVHDLTSEELNKFQNLKHYKADIPVDLRAKSDFSKFKEIRAESDDNGYVVSTLPLSGSRKEYIDRFIESFVKDNKSAGRYVFNFDFRFNIVPILSCIYHRGLNKENFAKKVIPNYKWDYVVKLIIAESKGLKIINGEGSKVAIDKEELTRIKIKKGEVVNIVEKDKKDTFEIDDSSLVYVKFWDNK